jgi:hypothetical protein
MPIHLNDKIVSEQKVVDFFLQLAAKNARNRK